LGFSTGMTSAGGDRFNLEAMARQAHTILIGQVVDQRSRWTPDRATIVTDVTLTVAAVLKGEAAAEFVLTVPGGVVGDRGIAVSDTPTFTPGEMAILFLREPAFSGFRLLGWQQGKFTVCEGRVLGMTGPPMPLAQFVDQVRAALGEAGPLPPDVAALIDRLSPAAAEATSALTIITHITPDAGPSLRDQLGGSGCAADSTRVTILGQGFGDSQGSSYVRFWRTGCVYNNACVESWSDSRIVARVPPGVSSGPVAVVVNGLASNEVYFTVPFAYCGGRWPEGVSPRYYVNPHNADVEATSALTAVQAAAETWSSAGTPFRLDYAGTVTITRDADDGINAVVWADFDSGTPGYTTWGFYTWDPHTIIGFDIVFNDPAYLWGSDGSPSRLDIQNVATTLFGHTLCLHKLYGTADAEKTMYGPVVAGETKKRTLAMADIAGLRYIYGPRYHLHLPLLLYHFAGGW